MKIKDWFEGEDEEKKEQRRCYLGIFKREGAAQWAGEFKS